MVGGQIAMLPSSSRGNIAVAEVTFVDLFDGINGPPLLNSQAGRETVNRAA
jgi:hypothetical protein